MAKKSYYQVQDVEENPAPAPGRRVSRAEQQVRPDQAMELAKALVALPPHEWPHIPLDVVTLRAIEEHARLKSRGALKRQLGRISSLLRNEDLDAIDKALGAGTTGRTERQEQIEDLVRWRTRLCSDGDDALSLFIEAYPDADRQRIRQLVARSRQLADSPRQSKTNRTLLDLLKQAAGL